ncbi:MAG: hypothetical protein KAV25_03580, partial [Methanophagales archaeon]|nr:hypothetical protein [Methanophagales archaeon]
WILTIRLMPLDVLHSNVRGKGMEEIVKNIKDRVGALETEVLAMKRIQGVQIEKKDPKAWERLDAIGKEISKSWKSKKQSWQLISESRR